MPKNRNHRVLCFPSSFLDELGRFHGLATDAEKYFPAVVQADRVSYVPRDQAENDPGLKQVIPYVLLVRDDKVFCYRRGKRGGETRLHELYSIGVGGHIEPDDRMLFSQEHLGYEETFWRELTEEVTLEIEPGRSVPPCVAVINDDSNAVGRVHFGIVHMLPVDSEAVTKKESSITDPQWICLEDALRRLERFETWSQLCLESFADIQAKSFAELR